MIILGLKSEGIFFVDPDEGLLQKIEELFNSGADVDFGRFPNGEYLAARTLYNFLQALPQPLLNLTSFSIIASK